MGADAAHRLLVELGERRRVGDEIRAEGGERLGGDLDRAGDPEERHDVDNEVVETRAALPEERARDERLRAGT